MKILFLQNTDDAMGGIPNVNIALMRRFLAEGKEVVLISVRHSGKNMKIGYPEDAVQFLINEKDLWGCPRYNVAVAYLKRGKAVAALRQVKDRLQYNKLIRNDYEKCQNVIRAEKPDVIINSHYELLDAVPEEFLSVTINHFHTSFDQVLENSSYQKIFEHYKNKIAKFVWLSEATRRRAVEAGLSNSTCIYNPVAFSTESTSDMQQKRAVFIGRFSEEKRVGLAARLFEETIRENGIDDWTFDIYGVGELEKEAEERIAGSNCVQLRGRTDRAGDTLMNYSVFILTSRFEGMALAVLEANECGIPVVCFNFGEVTEEEVIPGKTGLVAEQGDEEGYKECLRQLMQDEQLRREMSKKCKEFARKFQIDVIAEKWNTLFDEIRQKQM